jgi:hypothetical protein
MTGRQRFSSLTLRTRHQFGSDIGSDPLLSVFDRLPAVTNVVT